MADSLVNGHERPRLDGSASCPSYYSLGMRRKEAGLAARLPVQIYCNRLDFLRNPVPHQEEVTVAGPLASTNQRPSSSKR